MKELLVIRHAKSSWDSPFLEDSERPLNARGLRDAPMMAERIAHRNIALDLLLTSDAKRAYATCMFFAKEFPNAKVEIESNLYEALPKDFYEVIEDIDNRYTSVAVFSHNSGITDFVNELTNVHVDVVPTCGVFAVKIDVDDWKNFRKGKKAFWFFDYPKNLIK
ncbi:phosphohistidine phosphatase [Arachidicoccus ginsenosidimutans]|uniref:SixA phosphatase family protein n=1 Tax=Arachidicoccus sp. BS20 TaxID=1850526 RepID=UPI0007F0510E|nr:histidine phosphatase family protein [Arachidicoccus sp. BS20]ANI89194.1 phosphohistidine phosphatase [Arachidicoccus sp. BS20]